MPPGKLRLLAEFEGNRVDEVVDVQSGAATDVVLHPVTTGRANFHVAEAGTYLVVRFRGAEGEWTNWIVAPSRTVVS